MSRRENNGLLYINTSPPVQEQIIKPDARVKTIYDYFHKGKALIMDDLKYLYLKDPEGCKVLINKLVGKIPDEVESEFQQQIHEDLHALSLPEKSREYFLNQRDEVNASDEIYRALELVKEKIEKMDANEVRNLLDNINHEAGLKEEVYRLHGLDKSVAEKLVRFAYEMEEKLDIMA